MQTNEILEALDAQIIKLQQVRAILTDASLTTTEVATDKRRGRPKGSKNKSLAPVAPVAAVKSLKRTMSPEGKARIVAALKARWAAKRKADTPAKVAKKSTKTAAKSDAKSVQKASPAEKPTKL